MATREPYTPAPGFEDQRPNNNTYNVVAEWLDDPIAEMEALESVELTRQTVRRYLAQITPQIAAEVATAATLNPTASPEIIVGSTVVAGMPAEDELIAEAARVEQEQTGQVGGIGGFFADVGDGLRGVTRGLALGFSGLYDELVNRPLRTMANVSSHGMDLGEAYAASGNEPFGVAGEAIGALLRGEQVNVGSGWLPNSEMATPVNNAIAELNEDAKVFETGDQVAINAVYEKYGQRFGYIPPEFLSPAQQAMVLTSQITEKIMEQSTDPTTDLGKAQAQMGDPITQRQAAEADAVLWANQLMGRTNYSQVSIGRVYANFITEPGTREFHYASGTGDFLANMFMDPTIAMGAGIAKVSKAHRALGIGEAGEEALAGLATASRNVDDVVADIQRLEATPEYQRYHSWSSPQSRAKADLLAQQGMVDHALNPKLGRYQETGRVVQEYNRLQSELSTLANNPDLLRYEGWADATRGRVDELGDLTPAAWHALHRQRPGLARQYDVAKRAAQVRTQMDSVGNRITELAGTDEYSRFNKWSASAQDKALRLARDADIDPSVSPKLAEQQRVGRVVADLARQIDDETVKLNELQGMATFEHQVRQAAGILDGTRPDVDPKKIKEFISGPTARRWVEALRDGDLAKVDDLLSHVRGTIPRSLRLELANAKTNADVIAALMPHMGGTITDSGLGLSRLATTPIGQLHQAVNNRVTRHLIATGNRYQVKPLFSGSRLSRWFHEMSPHSMDLNSMDDAYAKLERHALNLGWNRGDEALEKHMTAFAQLEDGDWNGAFRVMANYNAELLGRLTDAGLDPHVAREVTRFTENQGKDAMYFVDRMGDEFGDPSRRTRVLMDGTEVIAPGPQLFTETFKGQIFMPSPQLVRRAAAELDAVGRWANAVATKGAKTGFEQRALIRMVDTVMTKAWKPMVLLRVAWPIRVIGEEQLRMMAMGISRPMTHPIHHIAMGLGDRKMADVFGDALTLSDEFARAKAGRITFQGDWRPKGPHHWVKTARDQNYEDWLDATFKELNQLWSDPVVRHLFDDTTSATAAHADRIESTVQWLQNDPRGVQILDALRKTSDDTTKLAIGQTDTIRQYVESVYARAHLKAGGNFRLLMPDGSFRSSRGHQYHGQIEDAQMVPKRPTYIIEEAGLDEILDAYGTGKFGGTAVSDRMAKDADILKAHPDLGDANIARKTLHTLAQSERGHALPSIVKGSRAPGAEMVSRWDRAVTQMFDVLMSRPTNYLSRSPAFREFYWRNMGEQLKFMDEATQSKVLTGARAAGTERELLLGAGIGKPIIGKADLPKGTGIVTELQIADQGAKSVALTRVQDLLFDVSKRKNVSDSLAIIMPFADAWGEVIGTWARITSERNVMPFRRFQQIIESGRESDAFDTTSGWSNDGFFRDDGEREVFTIPGLSDFWKKLSGADADWEYPLSGLSIATQILPGLGPVASFAVQPIIPKDPEWDWLREYAAPVGAQSLQRGLTPSSWQRFIAAFDWTRNTFADPALEQAYQGAVSDVLLAMSRDDPEFDNKIRADRDAVLEEARRAASRLFIVQGLARFVGPAAPSTLPTTEDKTGRIWKVTALHDELYKMVQQNNGDRIAAYEMFFERFGVDPVSIGESKSVKVRPTGQTEISSNFRSMNEELFEEYPNIAYFLGPAYLDDSAPFSWNAYYESIQVEDRVRLSPEQQLAMLNDTKGQLAYDKRKQDFEDEFGLEWDGAGWDTDTKQRLTVELKNYASDLMRQYPGFAGPGFGAEVEGIPSHVGVDQMISEWEQLIGERPQMVGTDDQGNPISPAAFAVAQYLGARAVANAGAQNEGFPSAMDAGEADPEHKNYRRREVLRNYAAELIVKHPEFGPIWEQVFGKEMVDDAEDEMTIEDAYERMGAGESEGMNYGR